MNSQCSSLNLCLEPAEIDAGNVQVVSTSDFMVPSSGPIICRKDFHVLGVRDHEVHTFFQDSPMHSIVSPMSVMLPHPHIEVVISFFSGLNSAPWSQFET